MENTSKVPDHAWQGLSAAPVDVQQKEEAQQAEEDLPVRVRVDVVEFGHQLHIQRMSALSSLHSPA